MALINNLYVHVVSEAISENVQSTSHPVEEGLDITSTIDVEPVGLSISGSIVDIEGKSATDIRDSLIALKDVGSLITYSGVNALSNMQIQSFSTTNTNAIAGGYEFSMTLKEVRIAQNAYDPNYESQSAATAPQEIKVGSIVIFKGGGVYVSSDAKKPAATRGRSTCKVTIINKRSWSIHDYHLISTDGGNVYGWVDGANIEGVAGGSGGGSGGSPKTGTPVKAGKQQTENTPAKGTRSSDYRVEGNGAVQEYMYMTISAGDTFNSIVKTCGVFGEVDIAGTRAANSTLFSPNGTFKSSAKGKQIKVWFKPK